MAGNENLLVVSEQVLDNKFNSLLTEISHLKQLINSQQQSPVDELLSEKMVGIKLGVCSKTIRNRLVKDREMAYTEIYGKRYVRASELDRYIQRNLIPRKEGR